MIHLEFCIINRDDHARIYLNDFHLFTLKNTDSNLGILFKAVLDLQSGKVPLYIDHEPYYLTEYEDVKYVLEILEKRDKFMKNMGLAIP